MNGFTALKEMTSHGNGYQDVELRDMINRGIIIGPRVQVSGRGIVWGGPTPGPKEKPDPELLNSIVVHSVEEARAAVRFEVDHGVDHIKLYPVGGYKFTPTGELQFEMTYPLEVMQAMDDEAQRLGVKTGSHAYGGEGLQNAITAGHAGDSIEHGQGLTQEMCNTMAQKGLFYSPDHSPLLHALHRGHRRQEHRRQVRDRPHLSQRMLRMCIATKGVVTVLGTGSEGADICAGHERPRVFSAGRNWRPDSSRRPCRPEPSMPQPKCDGRTISGRLRRVSLQTSSPFPAIRWPISARLST